MSGIPWRDLLEPGDLVAAGQTLSEPTALLDDLFATEALPDGLRLFVGMSIGDVLERCPPGIQMVTTVGMAPNGALIAEGRMDLVPCHMSEMPWLVSGGPCATDVALLLVSPPDADGFCSIGLGVDYIKPAADHARVIVAEVNDHVPMVPGDTRIHVDRIAASMRTSREIPEYLVAPPTGLERQIASHVAPLVADRSVIQVGIGRLGEAVLHSLADKRDLGIHSGMIGDTLLDLMDHGVVTGRAKSVDPGIATTGSVLGTAKAIARVGDGRPVQMRTIEHTHDPGVIGALDAFTAINTALEVDLLGQVNAEYAGDRYVGGIGGAVDFLRGARRAEGGRAVIALPASTGSGRSRIVPRVRHATSTRSDADTVVTQYGVAELRGASTAERIRRLIAIAEPEHRPSLEAAAARGDF